MMSDAPERVLLDLKGHVRDGRTEGGTDLLVSFGYWYHMKRTPKVVSANAKLYRFSCLGVAATVKSFSLSSCGALSDVLVAPIMVICVDSRVGECRFSPLLVPADNFITAFTSQTMQIVSVFTSRECCREAFLARWLGHFGPAETYSPLSRSGTPNFNKWHPTNMVHSLLRYTTTQERCLNIIGLAACMGAGAVQPLMNIPFGQVSRAAMG